MTITVQLDGSPKRLPASCHYGADCVTVDSWTCECGSNRAWGYGQSIEDHDTYRADAHCRDCGRKIGVMRARVETIFGLEEDEAMLKHGRARVYR